MTTKPGKDDVHEQRQSDQTAEGVVKGGSGFAGGGSAQTPRSAPHKPAPREHEPNDAAAPPRTPDTKNKPD